MLCSLPLSLVQKLSFCLLNLPPRSEVTAKIRALAGALIDRHIVLNKSSEVSAGLQAKHE